MGLMPGSPEEVHRRNGEARFKTTDGKSFLQSILSSKKSRP
jgi:hypothetical protein